MVRSRVGNAIVGFLALILALPLAAAPLSDIDRLQLSEDIWSFEQYVLRNGRAPTPDSGQRVVAAAENASAEPRILVAAFFAVREGYAKGDAAKLLERAASTEDSFAEATIGIELISGRILKADTKRGLKLLEKSKARGEAAAYYYLGLVYATGVPGGPNKDLARAEALLKQSIEFGMLRGYTILWKIAASRKMEEEAYRYMELAALSGDGEALVAIFNRNNSGELKDREKAMYWIHRGIMLGNTKLMFYYAMMLSQNTYGLSSDPLLENYLLQTAAEAGDIEAKVAISTSKITGSHGSRKDVKCGLEGLKRLVEDGHAEAEYAYGYILLTSNDVPNDHVLGKRLIEQSAASGYKPAKLWLESNPTKKP